MIDRLTLVLLKAALSTSLTLRGPFDKRSERDLDVCGRPSGRQPFGLIETVIIVFPVSKIELTKFP